MLRFVTQVNLIEKSENNLKVTKKCMNMKKVLRHIRTDYISMTPSMSDVYVVLPSFARASVIKFVKTLGFHIEYVFYRIYHSAKFSV